MPRLSTLAAATALFVVLTAALTLAMGVDPIHDVLAPTWSWLTGHLS